MNPQTFTSTAAGICRQLPALPGTTAAYWAFHPHPLPPSLPLDWELAGLLSEADRALAELSGAGQLLPNPHLLIRPYLRREAMLSSRIENTIADMEELALFDIQAERAPARPDVQEVANYVTALESGLQQLTHLPISTRLICDLHQQLLGGVRGGEPFKAPGELRRRQNWIGPTGALLHEATYVPPPPDEVVRALGHWESYLNDDSREPVLVKCALLHYQFEAIHPFLEGNGRIGRLLITLFLCSRQCLSQPLLYLSGFFDESREEYYRLLLAVSQRGEWRPWIEYFLRGVRTQARAALCDTQDIIRLYHHQRQVMVKSKRVPRLAAAVLDSLFGNPIFSVAYFSTVSGESYPSINQGVAFWIRHGFLRERTGKKRNRLFVADQLLNFAGPHSAALRDGETKPQSWQ